VFISTCVRMGRGARTKSRRSRERNT
jgi:hypothetical protein